MQEQRCQCNESYSPIGEVRRSVNGRAEFICPLQANCISCTYVEIEIAEIRSNALNDTYNPFVGNGRILSDAIQKSCQIFSLFIQVIDIVHNMTFFSERRAFYIDGKQIKCQIPERFISFYFYFVHNLMLLESDYRKDSNFSPLNYLKFSDSWLLQYLFLYVLKR